MKELFDEIREFRKSKKLVKDRADVDKEDEDRYTALIKVAIWGTKKWCR